MIKAPQAMGVTEHGRGVVDEESDEESVDVFRGVGGVTTQGS